MKRILLVVGLLLVLLVIFANPAVSTAQSARPMHNTELQNTVGGEPDLCAALGAWVLSNCIKNSDNSDGAVAGCWYASLGAYVVCFSAIIFIGF